MRPELSDVALEKVDAFRWKRVFEWLSVLYLFSSYDDVQRLARAWPDEISLNIGASRDCSYGSAPSAGSRPRRPSGPAPPLAGHLGAVGPGASTPPGASAVRRCCAGHRTAANASGWSRSARSDPA